MRADLRAKRPLLYQEVVNALYQIIDTSNLKPGDQMPAERELMEQLGVSRNVLREAFHILEQRGIITSQQGKGRFLREIPISQLGEDKQEEMSKNLERYSLYEAYEVRQVLETKAMDLIVRNATDSDLDEIETAYQTMLLRFAETNTTTGEFELHQLYAKKTGSVFMEQTLNIVLSTILEMMHTTSHNVMGSKRKKPITGGSLMHCTSGTAALLSKRCTTTFNIHLTSFNKATDKNDKSFS